MRIRGFMKVAMVLALIAVSLFALGGAALASTGINGPTPPAVGDPATGNVSPHGGFSATTNYCLQCHSVHSAPGGGARGYALMAEESVTAVCATCHGLFGASATGRNRPDLDIAGSPINIGTASSRTAYDVIGAALKAEHSLGAINPPSPDDAIQMYEVGWGYGGFNPARWSPDEVSDSGTSSVSGGGLYCGSCHTPHGSFGQAINTKYYRSDAGAGANEVQRIYVDHPQSGFQFTLQFGAQTTAALTYPVTAAQVQAALEALSNLDPGDVTVTGSGTSFTVTFGGPTYGLFDAPQLIPADLNALGVAETGTLVPGGPAGSLEAAYPWVDGGVIYDGATVKYLNLNGTGGWEKCDDAAGTVNCLALTKVDSEGQTKYLYGYNLLTTYPNHNWDNPESWGMAYRGRDAARWCGQCHPSKVSSEFGTAFTQHNHPTDCTYCHGNPNTGIGTSKDYPHTSDTGKFLKAYPDGICVTCHSAGSLV